MKNRSIPTDPLLEFDPRSLMNAPMILAVLAAVLLIAPLASAEPAHLDTSIRFMDSPAESAPRSIDDLLSVPDSDFIWDGDATDEDLAAAVTLGNDPDLERRNPFRKHSFDLFRSEHPLVIGQKEMVVRFRVRAKQRKAMSVELKF